MLDLKTVVAGGSTLAALVLAIVPETYLRNFVLFERISEDQNVMIIRVLIILATLLMCSVLNLLFLAVRRSVTIKNGNCVIQVKYGNLLREKGCKKVINFDECFTSEVGDRPEDINPKSLCGQYLLANPNLDVEALVADAGLLPEDVPSLFKGRKRYASGSLVANGEDLLMAFAKLNEDGRAEFSSREEYLACLSRLWDEIYKYHGQNDVCIPVLASGTTDFAGGVGQHLSQQEILDMIIWSYLLSAKKIKQPQKLRIVCRRQKGFSINKIAAR